MGRIQVYEKGCGWRNAAGAGVKLLAYQLAPRGWSKKSPPMTGNPLISTALAFVHVYAGIAQFAILSSTNDRFVSSFRQLATAWQALLAVGRASFAAPGSPQTGVDLQTEV